MFNFLNLILFVIQIGSKNGLKCTHFREEPELFSQKKRPRMRE